MSSERAGDVETICFELDGTLCTEIRADADHRETPVERAGGENRWAVADDRDRRGAHLADGAGVAERRRSVGKSTIESGDARETDWVVADEYGAIRTRNVVDPVPGAHDVLETLSEEYRLGVVTNGAPELQRAKLEATGLDGYVETVVCGGYETPAKPAVEPFAVALEALDSSPDRAVYVGDALSTDVAGARAAGLRSVWVPDGDTVPEQPEPTPEYTLERFEELTTMPWC